MEISGLKFRYVNYACYEIKLPNGKTIVVDPCIDYTQQITEFKKEDFEGADYILLSHTHYDHTMDLGYLEEKFNSKVIVGAMSAESLVKFFNIPFDNLYPVMPNEKFYFEDFTLEVFRGKHTFMNNKEHYYNNRIQGISPNFPKDHRFADTFGSMEYTDYLITTKENVKIFINGGQPSKFFFDNIEETMRHARPNIVIKQSSSKYTPEEFADTVANWHPQLVMPLHQDGLRKKAMTIEEYTERANAELERIGSFTKMLNPKPFKWYTVSMSVSED